MNIFRTPGGFMAPNLGNHGLQVGPSQPLFTRSAPAVPQEIVDAQAAIARGETVDFGKLSVDLLGAYDGLARGISTSTSAFPVRENLEAEAKILVPLDTPLRNRIPRVGGAGTAAAWRQVTALGGGWGSSVDQPGGGSAAQIFFGETGAPASLTTSYAAKSAAYKLMGEMGSVTGFSMAAGANFQNQYATERRNALMNFMLNEENALINGDATSTSAPWGDGTTAFAFNGLVNLVTTANGVPSAQVQTSVSTLTFAHIDAQLRRIWTQGGKSPYILLNQAQMQSVRDLAANATNGLYKIQAGGGNVVTVGLNVTGYVHPITGETVPFIVSKFLASGTMIFGCDYLPDGSPALQVDVLPQVQLPELAADQQVQGYTIQELAPTATAPQVFPFLISCYEVVKMKGATVFAKSTGVS